jgi:glycosyltransferase involved in cell wall biosynthesis
MKISIAMATYNGAKHLQEQLDSFVMQTRLPDELVVADDGSSDDTLCILDEFTKSAPFVVNVVRNEKNLGYAQNFSKALSLCSGELVFLSDQDDIWFNDKIFNIVQQAQANPNILLFMNDAELTLRDGKPLRLTKLGQTLSLGLGESAFTTGCCMAIRHRLLQLALPVPVDIFVHDTWLNQLALLLQVRMVIPNVMQYYRRHGENTSDWIASRTTKQSSSDLIKYYQNKDPRP